MELLPIMSMSNKHVVLFIAVHITLTSYAYQLLSTYRFISKMTYITLTSNTQFVLDTINERALELSEQDEVAKHCSFLNALLFRSS